MFKPLFALVISLCAPFAFADGDGRLGGSQVVVCPQAGGVDRVEPLSFWEARQKNWSIPESSAPVEDQVFAALDRMEAIRVASFADTELNDMMKDVEKKMLRINAEYFLKGGDDYAFVEWQEDVTYAVIDEGHELAWPAGCHREQIVQYHSWDNGTAYRINLALFRALSRTQQAGVIVELAVRITRGLTTPRSALDSRRITGYAMAGNRIDQWPNPKQPYVTCTADIYRDRKPHVDFTFFTDQASGELMGVVFSGFPGTPVGFYPAKPRLLHSMKETIDTILTYKNECKNERPGRIFPIVSMRGGGPVDFDKFGNVVGQCVNKKLKVFWTQESFGRFSQESLIPVTCKRGASS